MSHYRENSPPRAPRVPTRHTHVLEDLSDLFCIVCNTLAFVLLFVASVLWAFADAEDLIVVHRLLVVVFVTFAAGWGVFGAVRVLNALASREDGDA